MLILLQANQGQFNTTVYSDRDRFRGVYGTRMVLFMNPIDIDRAGLKDGMTVGLTTAIDDGVRRHVGGFIVRGYNIPEGCLAAYYPECNPLVPLSRITPREVSFRRSKACRCASSRVERAPRERVSPFRGVRA
jgi:anaerobic selenocysteine-containing dehydrogenase